MAQHPLVDQGFLIVEASRSHSETLTTFSRNSLDGWSARRGDLHLTTHNTDKWKTDMPLAGFEPTIPASERPKTHTLDRAATGIGNLSYVLECVIESIHVNEGRKYFPRWPHVGQPCCMWRIDPRVSENAKCRGEYLVLSRRGALFVSVRRRLLCQVFLLVIGGPFRQIPIRAR